MGEGGGRRERDTQLEKEREERKRHTIGEEWRVEMIETDSSGRGDGEKEPPMKKEERGEKDTYKERRGREEAKRHTIREG